MATVGAGQLNGGGEGESEMASRDMSSKEACKVVSPARAAAAAAAASKAIVSVLEEEKNKCAAFFYQFSFLVNFLFYLSWVVAD
jgi:hypothetical protein